MGIWEFSQMPILIKNVNAVVSWVKSKKGTPAAKSKMVLDKKNVFQWSKEKNCKIQWLNKTNSNIKPIKSMIPGIKGINLSKKKS